MTESIATATNEEPTLDKVAILKTLYAIQNHEPEQFIMGSFISQSVHNKLRFYDEQVVYAPTCSTTACIAGWAALTLANEHKAWAEHPGRNDPNQLNSTADIYAAKAFGLNKLQFYQLFYMHEDPQKTGTNIINENCAYVMKVYGIDVCTSFGQDIGKEVIRWFDLLPSVFRKQCAIEVLTGLIQLEKVNWSRAMSIAAEKCGWKLLRPDV